MDAEFNVNQWGTSVFQDSILQLFVCVDGSVQNLIPTSTDSVRSNGTTPVSAQSTAAVEVALVQGAPAEVGFRITPPSGCTDVSSFFMGWERALPNLTLDISFHSTNGDPVLMEASSVHTASQSLTMKSSVMGKPTLQRAGDESIVISKIIVSSPGYRWLDVPLSLHVMLNLIPKVASTPTFYRETMDSEEQTLRAFVEVCRYGAPRAVPKLFVVPARVLTSLLSQPWCKHIDMWTCLVGVNITNSHPFQTIDVEDVELLLDESVMENIDKSSMYGYFGDSGESYRFSRSLLRDSFEMKCINGDAPHKISLGPLNSYTIIFELHSKLLEFDRNKPYPANTNALPSSNSEVGNALNPSKEVVVSPLLSPESARLHEFSTPIKIRWRSLPKTESPDAPSVFIAQYKSPFNDILINHFINSMDFIAWTGCIPKYFDVNSAPVDTYCPEFDMKMGDLFIDFYGPSFAYSQIPFKLQISVTNSTHAVKVLRLEVVIGDENVPEPDSIFFPERKDARLTLVSHESEVFIGKLRPGESRTVALTLMPLQSGLAKLQGVTIFDSESGLSFKPASCYEILVLE